MRTIRGWAGCRDRHRRCGQKRCSASGHPAHPWRRLERSASEMTVVCEDMAPGPAKIAHRTISLLFERKISAPCLFETRRQLHAGAHGWMIESNTGWRSPPMPHADLAHGRQRESGYAPRQAQPERLVLDQRFRGAPPARHAGGCDRARIGRQCLGNRPAEGAQLLRRDACLTRTIREKHATAPIAIVSPIAFKRGNVETSEGGISVGRMRELLGRSSLRATPGKPLSGLGDLDDLPDGIHPDARGNHLIGEQLFELMLWQGKPLADQ